MENAEFVDSIAMSSSAAIRDPGVHATTLKDQLSGRVRHETKQRPVPYLSSYEEEQLVSTFQKQAKMVTVKSGKLV